ncbi:MAG: dephospho-CoA kinase, partial [SAR324 cluster bacterium]|nr:dephospho-CoA kinase [SAR324 cluster bacterium]
LKRLALRNGLSREEAKQRISSQISSEERLDHADLVLENNGTETDLEEKLKEALEDLQTLED